MKRLARSSGCPKKRILGAVLFLILAAAGVRWGVAPQVLGLPENFHYEAELSSRDNFYDPIEDQYQGAEYSVSTFYYEVASVSDQGFEIKNGFDVTTIEGESIFSVERLYGIDPMTGAHVPGLGDADRSGFLFAPQGLKPREPFTYWHANYNAPAEMSFVGEETLYGLPVYHYETYYEGQTVDQTENLTHLEGVPDVRGVRVEPVLHLWVEPVTGYLVKYMDESTAYFYDQVTGATIEPWNHFSNTYIEESVIKQVEIAETQKMKQQVWKMVIPLFLLGVACFIGFYCPWHYRHQAEAVAPIGLALPFFVVVLPLGALALILSFLYQSMQGELEARFEERLSSIQEGVVGRMEIYINTLEGVSGLFAASQTVERDEWKAYVEELELQENYPGIQGVGFAQVIYAEEKEAHLEQIRSEGFPDYAITPEGERDVYTSIIYLEPFEDRNLRAFGYDMMTEAVRAEAMEKARDTGEPSISGPVTLMQETGIDNQVGFLVYIPIYKKGFSTETVAERQIAIQGYAYAPFRAEDLMQAIWGGDALGVNFALYAGTSVEEAQQLYQHTEKDVTSSERRWVTTETVYVAGTPWTFHFTGLDEFELDESQRLMLYTTVAGGLSLSALFIFIYFALAFSRQQMIRYIRQKSFKKINWGGRG